MSVGLINWSGHKNLGDDAMAKILLQVIPNSVNMKESPWEADWYIVGGGTLISPQSLFFGILPNPERTIGVSLGVSCNWNGENVEILRRMKKIYCRDLFSFNKLRMWDVPCELSVDLLCYLLPSTGKARTNGVWANLMYAPGSVVSSHLTDLITLKEHLALQDGVNYFAMSPDEDLDTVPSAFVYTCAQTLIDDLVGAESVYVTRLHAHIAAWIAGHKGNVHQIVYDPKISHFYERVYNLSPIEANIIITSHLSEICELVS
jgi:polysaccharide pyruvyl transferase WcaK-like protein